MPLHRVWEYRDIGRLFITVGGEESDNRGAEVGLWVEVILRVSLEVILRKPLRHPHPARRLARSASGDPLFTTAALFLVHLLGARLQVMPRKESAPRGQQLRVRAGLDRSRPSLKSTFAGFHT